MANIELVIKIDEDTLQDLYDSRYVSPHIKDVFRSAIILPKGHGRLGDLDKILREDSIDYYTEYGCEVRVSALDIDLAPTIIPADEESDYTQDGDYEYIKECNCENCEYSDQCSQISEIYQ